MNWCGIRGWKDAANDDIWMMDHPIVLFDGVCNLCNASVDWLIDRDQQKRLRFASLQSETGKALLGKLNLPASSLDTLVLIEGDRASTQSTAALRIARLLPVPWSFMYGLVLAPRLFRDAIYAWVANHRYRWFGRAEICRLPTQELKERFLD